MSKFQDLSTAEKILLAEELWDSALADEASVPMSDEHRKIIEQRLKAYEEDVDAGAPWEVAKKRILETE